MALDFKIIQHDGFLEIIVTGSYSLKDSLYRFPHVLDVCRLTGIQRVLIDYREMQGEGGGTEKSLYAFGIEDHYRKYLEAGGQELRVAYLGPRITSYEPSVQIAESSELPFKLFDDPNKALAWLEIKTT